MDKPTGVSEYELTRALPASLKSALPTIEEIEAELADTAAAQPSGPAASHATKKRKSRTASKPTRLRPTKEAPPTMSGKTLAEHVTPLPIARRQSSAYVKGFQAARIDAVMQATTATVRAHCRVMARPIKIWVSCFALPWIFEPSSLRSRINWFRA